MRQVVGRESGRVPRRDITKKGKEGPLCDTHIYIDIYQHLGESRGSIFSSSSSTGILPQIFATQKSSHFIIRIDFLLWTKFFRGFLE